MWMQAVRESLRVARPIEEVWRAWSDPDWLAGWHAERVEGEVAEGQAIRLTWDSLGIAIELEVAELEAPHRLVLRGAPPGRPVQTLSIDLARIEGGGATSLAIRHDGFPPGPGGEEERAGTAAGWHTSARVLAHYLDHHAGRARASGAALAPVAASLADVAPLFERPSWLFGDVALGGEGSRFHGRAAGDRPLAGCVLARALPRQIALAIDDTAGILVLRAIQLDPGAVLLGALTWSWQPDRPAHADLAGSLEPALERLVAALGGAHRGGAA